VPLRALLIDALGTTVRLLPPWEAIDPRAVEDIPPEQVEEAFRAEMSHYKAHAHEAVDADSLAELRADCAGILSRELGRDIAPQTMMNAIRFEAYPDAAPALSEARDSGLRVVCVSNWDYELPTVLAEVGLAGCFDAVLTSAGSGARKPDPAIFARALDLAGCSAAEAIHVGDTDDDVNGARAAGVRVLRIDRDGDGGDISSLAELSAARSEEGIGGHFGPASIDRPASPPGAASAPPPRTEVPDKRRNSITNFVGLPEGRWSAMTVLLGILVAVGTLLIGTIVVAAFDPEIETDAGTYAVQLIVGLAFAGTAIAFAASEVGGRIREALARLGIGEITKRIVVIAALGWLTYLACAALLVPILQPEQQDVTRELGADTESVLSLIIAGFLIIIVAPLSEELFFRGFMFAGLRRSMDIWPAAIISGAIFGSLHLSGGNVGVAIQLSIFGVILAYLYERSGSLWAPILTHTLNNTIAFVLLVTDVV